METLAKFSIADVQCGKDSTACITDTGRLYTWGKGMAGKLGLGSQAKGSYGNRPVAVPTRIDFFASKVVCLVSLGRNHSCALTDDSRVFLWGSNTFGQLGMPDVTNYSSTPAEITSLREQHVRHFACGGWHTIVCTWSGTVFSCGKGWHGQLGQGDYESLTAQSKTLPYFKKIMRGFADHRVVKVFGGIEMSGALSETGRVFTWGQGDQCQLGHDSTNNESEPRELEALGKIRIVDLCMGAAHMVALDEKGIPYTWGKGANGQLGHGELAEKERTPRPVELCRRFIKGLGGSDAKQRDMEWGSFYFKKERLPLENGEPGEEDREIEYRQKGKVVMISAEHNYTLFVLERLANEAEILAYQVAVSKGLAVQRKYTNMTVVRELFGTGSGKGGVLQSIGKETEYLPKLMPESYTGDLIQDIIKISAGKAHVGIITREDHLRNLESKNIDEKLLKDQMVQREKKAQGSADHQLLDLAMNEEADIANAKAQMMRNPFSVEIETALDKYLGSIPGFDKDKWLPALLDNQIDIETLSTLSTDDQLKECGITAIGARRRLMRELGNLPKRYAPVFYSCHNSRYIYYISSPPINPKP